MRTALIRYDYIKQCWCVDYRWYGSCAEFEYAQDAIDWCKSHGYRIAWEQTK